MVDFANFVLSMSKQEDLTHQARMLMCEAMRLSAMSKRPQVAVASQNPPPPTQFELEQAAVECERRAHQCAQEAATWGASYMQAMRAGAERRSPVDHETRASRLNGLAGGDRPAGKIGLD